ncbi:hypothetical protein Efla_006913 [Eimeria flavescens]
MPRPPRQREGLRRLLPRHGLSSSLLLFVAASAAWLAPVSASPVPVPPSNPYAPSVSRFPLQRDPLDPPRLLLLHDFFPNNTHAQDAQEEALLKGREAYADVLRFIEEKEKIEVVSHHLSSPLRLFYLGEPAYQFILIISTTPDQGEPAGGASSPTAARLSLLSAAFSHPDCCLLSPSVLLASVCLRQLALGVSSLLLLVAKAHVV